MPIAAPTADQKTRSRDASAEPPARSHLDRPARPVPKKNGTRSNSPRSESKGLSVEADPIWASYRDNLARHLIGIARDLQTRVLECLVADGRWNGLRPSWSPLLAMVALAPRPLSALASPLGISPQACSQMINGAESAGYLERQPDPNDRRSRIVCLTSKGQSLVAAAAEALQDVEMDYRARVGDSDYASWLAALFALFRALGFEPANAESVPTRSSLGLITLLSIRVQKDLMQASLDRGHSGLKMSHAQVLPLIGPEGARVGELARIQHVSRQAISVTARDLESLGVLRREPDPRDRRGVVFLLTKPGLQLIRDSVTAVDAIREDWQKHLGEDRIAHLRNVARRLYQSLHLEAGIFEMRTTRPSHVRGSTHSLAALQEIPAARDEALARLASDLTIQLGEQDAVRLAHLLDPSRRPDSGTPSKLNIHPNEAKRPQPRRKRSPRS